MILPAWRTVARRRLVAVTAAFALVFVVVIAWRLGGSLQTAELVAYDAFIRWAAAGGRAGAPVVVVAASETDLERFGWPLPDATLARLLALITAEGPRAVGVDIYRDKPIGPGRGELDRVIAADDRIVWVTKFREGAWEGVGPPQRLAGSDRAGFGDIVVDPGGVVRRALLFVDDGVDVQLGFALRVALRSLRDHGIGLAPDPDDAAHARLGRVTLVPLEADDGGYVGADAGGYQVLLDYAAGPDAFTPVSVSEVLDGTVPAAMFRNRIVLIGTAAASVKDLVYSPFSGGGGGHDGGSGAAGPMFGVQFHAHVVDQLVRGATEGEPPITARPRWQEWVWIAAWSLLGGFAGAFIARPWPFVAAATLAAGALIGLCGAAFAAGVWLPLVPAGLALVASGALVKAYEAASERTLRRSLARYVAPALVDQLVADPSQGKPGGERRELTLVFTDIADFTGLAERLGPEALAPLLNAYLDRLCETVHGHGGTIDKIVGDALLVFFGAPLLQPDHARRGVLCALELDAVAEGFAAEQRARGTAFGSTRIGVHTGTAMVGSFGGRRLLDYTAHGDALNTAARLEAANKHFGTRICVSLATAERCPGIRFRPIGDLMLEGKTEAVRAFEPLPSPLPPALAYEPYLEAFDRVRTNEPDACTRLQDLRTAFPDDPLVAFYAAFLLNGGSGIVHTIRKG